MTRVKRPPQGPQQRVAAGVRQPSLSSRNPREPLTMTVTYRGGSEAWYQVEARGRVWRFPGAVCLHDALGVVCEGRGGIPRSEAFPKKGRKNL